MHIIQREMTQELLKASRAYPVTTILGPRQSGKTTLTRLTFPEKPYVNMEAPDTRQIALSDPRRFLAQYPNGVILDEIQRTPELLSYIQVLVDERKENGQYILTGSHQLNLSQEVSQSLAGRTAVLHLYPLSLSELAFTHGKYNTDEQIICGGYPRIYENNLTPRRFYSDYVQTYLERDLKQIINVKDLDQFQRFLYLCAARVGCLLDYTGFANDLGISRHTIKEWISVLKASFVIFTLPPYFENFGKQVIKSPKLYFSDVGLLSYLLGVQETIQISRHPLRGKIFENLVILELIKNRFNRGIQPNFFFYRDNQKNEVDIIIPYGGDLVAIEIKSSETFHKDFLKTLKKMESIAKTKKIKSFIAYAGTQEQVIQNIRLLNYQNISKLDEWI